MTERKIDFEISRGESAMHPAEEAAHNFVRFIQNWEPLARQPDDGVALSHCLSFWLQFGDGTESIKGDFTVFVLTALVIGDWLLVDPTLLDYRYTISRGRPRNIRRRVGRLLGHWETTYELTCLRELFDAYVTRRAATVRDSPR